MRHQIDGAPVYRLFYAFKPPTAVARQVDHFAEGLADGAPRIRVEHQHVTLGITADYGGYPHTVAERLLRAGAAVMADPFEVRLDHLSFANRSVALRPSRAVPPLNALQRELTCAMRRVRVPLRPDWSFSPHQTLFYRKGAVGQRRIEGFGWRVEDFVLVCSHVGRTYHEELGRWPLRGGAQLSLF